MNKRPKIILNAFFGVFFALIFFGAEAKMSYAATTAPKTSAVKPIEISGWIPYWRKATGTAETFNHLDTFKEINPFGYTMKVDGTIFDAMKIDEEPWPSLIQAARVKKIRVIPTIMWSNAEAIHKILSNTKKRIALEDAITALVKEKNFDGIDIDFEGKYAKTKTYFATFLKGLYQRMGKKWVMCTIEARTPLDSRYDTPPAGGPKNIQYANDFVAINKYCDRVRIMAYDQGSIDVKLNQAAPGLYVPVADIKWVEKVVRLTMQTISKNKIVIGVPTYGYEYEFTALKEEGYKYDLLWAFNPRYALELAQQLSITPERNIAGELSFTYSTSSQSIPSSGAVSTDTALSNNDLVASSSPVSGGSSQHILWWSDAAAIKDKIALARKLGVAGVAVFKIDGGADPAIWDVLK